MSNFFFGHFFPGKFPNKKKTDQTFLFILFNFLFDASNKILTIFYFQISLSLPRWIIRFIESNIDSVVVISLSLYDHIIFSFRAWKERKKEKIFSESFSHFFSACVFVCSSIKKSLLDLTWISNWFRYISPARNFSGKKRIKKTNQNS